MAFVKGDIRINRKGRPKGYDPVRLLAQRIAEEPAGEGDPRMTILEGILRQWATDPKLQPAFLECAYGKAPPASTPFTLPEDSSLTAKGEAVLLAISRGELAPDQGAKLLQTLTGQARLVETTELTARIAALESTVKPQVTLRSA